MTKCCSKHFIVLWYSKTCFSAVNHHMKVPGSQSDYKFQDPKGWSQKIVHNIIRKLNYIIIVCYMERNIIHSILCWGFIMVKLTLTAYKQLLKMHLITTIYWKVLLLKSVCSMCTHYPDPPRGHPANFTWVKRVMEALKTPYWGFWQGEMVRANQLGHVHKMKNYK